MTTTASPGERIESPVLDTLLSSGLRLVAVRDTTVPLVEIRLSFPCLGAGEEHAATAHTLGDLLLRHTDEEQRSLPVEWRACELDSGRDVDRLGAFGYASASGIEQVLRVLAERLARPHHPKEVVLEARQRLAAQVSISRGDARWTALAALLRRRHPADALPFDMPDPELLRHVEPADVAALHRARIRPDAATLVLVGDLPADIVPMTERALAPWQNDGPPAPAFRAPVLPPVPGEPALVHRARSAQAEILLAGRAPHRAHDQRPAFDVANVLLGGEVASRLSRNLREDKGYAYAVGSGVEVVAQLPTVMIQLGVGEPHVAAALAEVRTELVRLAEEPVDEGELDAARRLLSGRVATAQVSPSSRATFLSNLVAEGATSAWLDTYPRRLASLTPADVRAAARACLHPDVLDVIVVGDTASLAGPLDEFAELNVRRYARLADVTSVTPSHTALSAEGTR
ncbi:M16 family metallopeptidase [Streptomyces afghaniensis]|uniref:M16 family metallopeptidase n=1 Tax=Streptomyces afghaniensis TaxID=66865 RepID=UPI002784BF45|nr:pitrilysin family protein [Streptomyces afghaniensis]MDQ1018100.1 zinc protease [Streptomyces afghaniensis]